MSDSRGARAPGLPRFTDLEEEYEIVRELGRGGTAVVYLARERELDRDVAIKVIRATYVEDTEASARLVREAKTVAGLQHPNVVMLYGTRRLSDGSIALIMQYVPGRPLKDAIRSEGPLSADLTESVLKDIGKALGYAHERRIVHRDIKPENIYLDREAGIARLADFGIARPWDTDSGLTLPGVAIGTPAYMSPEQIDGRELDGRSDLYSLGLVGYEMLTGEAPWSGENVYKTIFKQRHEALPRLSEERPDLPENLLLAISGCLVKDRDRRWDDASRFMEVLEGDSPEDADEILEAAWSDSDEVDGKLPPGEAGEDRWAASDAPTIRYSRDADGRVILDEVDEGEAAAVRSTNAVTPRVDPRGPRAPGTGVDPDTELERRVGARRKERGRGKGRRWIAGLLVLGVAGLVGMGIWTFQGGDLAFLDLGVPSSDAGGAVAGGGSDFGEEGTGPMSGSASGGAGAPIGRDGAGGGADGGAGDEGGATSDGAGGGGPPSGIGTGAPAALTALSGNGQTGATGDTLPVPVAVVVRDSTGQAVSGATVRFSALSAGGAAIPPSVRTDDLGMAETRWRLGSGGGRHALVATVEGRPGLETRFEALVTEPAAAGLTVLSGGGQRSVPGEALPEPVRIRVVDGTGSPVANSLVAFSSTPAGGTVEPSTVTTDEDGIAEVRWRLADRPGEQTLEAYLPEAEDASVTVRAEALLPSLSPRATVAAGGTHSCALDPSGRAVCWGDNASGQIGAGGSGRQMEPARVVTGARFARLATGVSFTCGLSVDGEAYCWGDNDGGQLGTGDTAPRSTPAAVATDRRFQELGVGLDHACGVSRDGVLLCWGSNEAGKLGTGNQIDHQEPEPVIGGFRYSSVAVGWGHTCGLTRDSGAVCWGRNASGELGDGTTTARAVPTRVEGSRTYRALAAGSAHTCGLTVGGELYCWGQNTFGQLGDGGGGNRLTPSPVALDAEFASVVAGGVHTCALAADGVAYCWGRNAYGQLGDGTNQDRTAPVPVAGDHRFVSLSAQGAHTCGQTREGATLCWGYNSDGQLGDGTRTNRSAPVRSGI